MPYRQGNLLKAKRMDELIEILQEYKEKNASLKACTIVLEDEGEYYKYLITSDFNGNVYVEEIP